MPHLISRYGASTTLRILAISIGVPLLPPLPRLKGRLPIAAAVYQEGWQARITWMKNRLFLRMNTVQEFAIGYFVPIFKLPSALSCIRPSLQRSPPMMAVDPSDTRSLIRPLLSFTVMLDNPTSLECYVCAQFNRPGALASPLIYQSAISLPANCQRRYFPSSLDDISSGLRSLR
ncbi:hypothetical protein FB45DRAFT_1099086 [Roridomyces roridus]|uniref:Uncharacterized protein n=1 Tax=Roridomyces roridus TaxID=1738132 RepID=A0AAD7CEF4_9AGAR|nr:hypothetical protein FB45DRAFT_1099086 [Roridomyces roridus]